MRISDWSSDVCSSDLEEAAGCGIASVAALAGMSYQQARVAAAKLGIFAADPKLWSQTAPVRSLLAHFDLHAAPRETPFRSWNELPALALLATKWHLERDQADRKSTRLNPSH